ncbi:prenyltransferase/squalene oxidase repeat-containing protein, partial [Bradyrhizobium sp. 31Argb]|uniref:prenyltransferase/squalene oxidase repeat-containing protein n=1 Tax=Bradyrhizobium sp. 31Argb TaxID=3141247 RepID=UPI00374A8E9A
MNINRLETRSALQPLSDRLSHTIQSAIDWLSKTQDASGFWVGMVESNSTIEAEWLLASHMLGFQLPSEKEVIKALLQRQRPDGSWGIYPGAPDGDINSTVEVYAALRARVCWDSSGVYHGSGQMDHGCEALI